MLLLWLLHTNSLFCIYNYKPSTILFPIFALFSIFFSPARIVETKVVVVVASCPSSNNRKSCHWITEGDRLNLFKKIHSAFSAPTGEKLVDTGLEKVLKILLSGFRKKVFPRFATPAIIMLRYFPRPFSKRSRTHSTKYWKWTLIPLLSNTSLAHANHWPQQSSVHSLCLASWSNYTLLFLFLSLFKSSVEFSISYAVSKTFDTTLVPLVTKSLRCQFCL